MSPQLTSASIDTATGEVVIYADGVAVLRLSRRKGMLLLARLAEALA